MRDHQTFKTLFLSRTQVEKQQEVINLVNDILNVKEMNSVADTQNLENRIDLLVYQLYGLTYDKVLIIDP